MHSGLLLGAGMFAAWILSLWLPPPVSDRLRSSAVAAPLVIAGLAVIGRWAVLRGGSRANSRTVAMEWALLALTLLGVSGRNQWGLAPHGEALDLVLFAALLLLLAHRVCRVLIALRPSLGETLTTSPSWPFFALPLIVYLAILPWSATSHRPDGDEPHYLLLTHSLAYDFDTDLANNYENTDSLRFMNRAIEPQFGDPIGQQGELYSRHNVVLPILLAPAYRLFGTLGALLVMSVLTAASVWLMLGLAAHYTPDHPAETLVAFSLLAFTAPLLLFSYQIWVEVPAAVLVLIVLIQIHRIGMPETDSRLGWLWLVGALLLLPLLKLRFLLIAVFLVVLMSIRSDRAVRKGTLLLIAGLAVLGPGILLFNQSVFQNPLKYHDIDGLKPYVLPLFNYFQGFTGLAFDCAFGLFAFAPIWLLLLPAFGLLTIRRSNLLVDFSIVFVPYLILLAPRGEWFGAWSPPFRYGIVMLPMLALWLVPLLARRNRPGARGLIAGLSALTAILTLLWIVEPAWTYNLANGRSDILDLLAMRTGSDLARFFPSSTRLRAATWIWPPVSFGLLTLLWWMRLPRRRVAVSVGLAGSLLAPALLFWAARATPTRVIEFEDPWVEKHSGRLYPDIWVIYRPQFRGGWTLANRQSLTVPLVSGGERFDMQLDFRDRYDLPVAGSLVLRGQDGSTLARRVILGLNDWQSTPFYNLPRPKGDRLTIEFLPPPGINSHALLDRAFLSWKN